MHHPQATPPLLLRWKRTGRHDQSWRFRPVRLQNAIERATPSPVNPRMASALGGADCSPVALGFGGCLGPVIDEKTKVVYNIDDAVLL